MERCLGCMKEFDGSYGICPYCGYEPGTDAESALHMQPGVILNNRYLVGRVIGYGGFGVTYIGWDETLEQVVAIKEYLPSEFATRTYGQTQVTVFSGDKMEQFNSGMDKFIEEARRLAKFVNEEGIVRVFDSFEYNNTAYIVMEYLDGETLTSYIEREGKIPIDKAVELLKPIIKSLQAVHREGIIHRDIAPDNIMITKDGEMKLIDFGAARYATTSHSRSLTVIIKPGYSPEEQYRSRGDQGPQTDVYALGAVLYRMITGVTPPDALERRAYYENKRKDILEPPSKFCKIPKNLENAVLNALNIRIEDRTPDMETFLEQLTSENVSRMEGAIKAIDHMRWPLWAKIALPMAGVIVIVLLTLFATGIIGFSSNLATERKIDEGMTVVPSVINYSTTTALDTLSLQNLSGIISGREESDIVPTDMVLRQSVDAGDVVENSTVVELYVSAPVEQVVEEGHMPNVQYYEQDEAREILEELGLIVSVETMYSNDVSEGLVLYTDISPNDIIDVGDEVTMYVSLGPDPNAVVETEDSDGDSGAGTNSPSVATAALSLNHQTLSFYVGDPSTTLTVNGGGGDYTWESSNTNVATVTSGGVVTAVGKGTATITVTSGEKTTSCNVTVNDFSLSLSQSYATMVVGNTMSLSASGAPSGTSISWSSSNSSVASVSSSGRVTAVSAGNATITAQFTYNSNRYSASCSVSVQTNIVPAISVSASGTSNLYPGDTATITANTTPAGQSVTWSSSNTSVATILGGSLTAQGSGTATITATMTYDGRSYSATTSVSVNAGSLSISGGGSLDLGKTLQLSASNKRPSNGTVSWSSSNTSVATVSSSGLVTAKGSGSTVITATLTNNGKQLATATTSISVADPKITLDTSSISLLAGDSKKLTATTSPSSGGTVTWSSGNANIAKVSNSGEVTAVSNGSTTITASFTYGGTTKTAQCSVSVTALSLTISNSSMTMMLGGNETLTATANSTNGIVTWKSSDSTVATVSDGKITARDVGTATITATFTAYTGATASATCTVTVIKPTISISNESLKLTPGETGQLSASVTPTSASIYWESSDSSVAKVSGSGSSATVTAVETGTCTITASVVAGSNVISATCNVTVGNAASTLAINSLTAQGATDRVGVSLSISSNYPLNGFTVEVADSSGAVLASEVYGTSNGATSVSWSGQSLTVPGVTSGGHYTVTVSAFDQSGATTEKSAIFTAS